jgi:hypothetical protein
MREFLYHTDNPLPAFLMITLQDQHFPFFPVFFTYGTVTSESVNYVTYCGTV